MTIQANIQERRLLKISIAATSLSAAASVLFGLWISSKSIVFDGFYEIVDAGMTTLALLTTRLIARGEDSRFQYGYWHLEPILALVSGLILVFACIYGFVDGLNGLLTGGREVAFRAGAIFTAVTGAISFALFGYIRRSGRALQSQFLEVDARAWLMGGVLSAGLCVSFVTGEALSQTPAAIYAPYVDPIVLMLVCVGLLPFPALTLIRAGRDILQIAPVDLDGRIRALVEVVAQRHGFASFTVYVMRSGRQLFVEIGFVAPSGEMTKSFAELDTIRGEIADGMGGLGPGYWLTVDFTADARWI